MRHNIVVSALGILTLATTAHGQVQALPPAPDAAAANSTSAGRGTSTGDGLDADFYSNKLGPVTVAAGPATGGGFGVSVSGDQGAPLISLYTTAPDQPTQTDAWYQAYMASLSYKVDGLFTTHASSPNSASISLDPGLDWSTSYGRVIKHADDCKPDAATNTSCPDKFPSSKFGMGVTGDIEYRYGTVKQQDGTLVNTNQALVGASIYFVPTVLRSRSPFFVAPQITASYYKPVTTDTSAITLPSGIKANYLQTEFRTEVGWYINQKYPLALDVRYDGSRAFTGTDRAWQSLWKLQLSIGVSGSSIKPAVTYQSGSNGGLQYDRQVIFGFLAELLKP